jgi:hypothetical protein
MSPQPRALAEDKPRRLPEKPSEAPVPSAPVEAAPPPALAPDAPSTPAAPEVAEAKLAVPPEYKGQRLKRVKHPRLSFEIAEGAVFEQYSLTWWAEHKGLPVWLMKAIGANQPVNKQWTEAEIDEAAARLAQLPLGRKGRA